MVSIIVTNSISIFSSSRLIVTMSSITRNSVYGRNIIIDTLLLIVIVSFVSLMITIIIKMKHK